MLVLQNGLGSHITTVPPSDITIFAKVWILAISMDSIDMAIDTVLRKLSVYRMYRLRQIIDLVTVLPDPWANRTAIFPVAGASSHGSRRNMDDMHLHALDYYLHSIGQILESVEARCMLGSYGVLLRPADTEHYYGPSNSGLSDLGRVSPVSKSCPRQQACTVIYEGCSRHDVCSGSPVGQRRLVERYMQARLTQCRTLVFDIVRLVVFLQIDPSSSDITCKLRSVVLCYHC